MTIKFISIPPNKPIYTRCALLIEQHAEFLALTARIPHALICLDAMLINQYIIT